MTASTHHTSTSGLDDQAAVALREILTDPSLPVYSSTAEVGGRATGRLREAIDHLTSLRVTAQPTGFADDPDGWWAAVSQLDPGLADALGWHVELHRILAAAPPSAARNAILGDIARGDVLTWAGTPQRWEWLSQPPSTEQPLTRVDAEFTVPDHPSLFDAIVVAQSSDTEVLAIPTFHEAISWTPLNSVATEEHTPWLVRLTAATVHLNDLIKLQAPARLSAAWRHTGAD